ncbi:C6 transcription factor [Aspergillus sclerotioniger CBS 115572]|uniref:C6 transcription factor n=1 Tax=Aspergillus sclerotioniger CBS 115572 TaxID=1450535 RepID=A0A317VUD1_9EURO|nr:C6 transcription factor [Aspergillus sclerotioniger CBS 115572]PWY77199.1 C6 transcription factor [Aspergillus sclerotioniger CBS 115572]
MTKYNNTSHTLTSTRKRCRREGAKWTRSGCLTCKRRRKRCDETKPCCQSCARLGLNCEGYGSMWAAPLDPSAHVFSQDRASKRRRISAPSSPTTYSHGTVEELCSSASSPLPSNPSTAPTSPSVLEHTSSYFLSDEDSNGGGDKVTDSHVGRHDALTVASPMPSRFFSHLSQLETHYLQYHTELGSKLLANLESDDNPLRSLVIPRALSSPLVLKALCAVSATHFANRSRDRLEAQTAATSYYVRTLNGLQLTLSEFSAGDFPDDIILAVALLCKYEIVRGSVKQWAVHLNALQKLIMARGGVYTLDEDTREFVSGFYIYAYNVARISNRNQINSDWLDICDVKITKLDIYIGYAEDLIKICAQIADLPLMSHDPVALGLEIHGIDTSLRNWTHTRTQYIIPKGITEMNLARLRMVADCFRDAAYIYLHSILKKMSQGIRTPFSTPWTTFISLPRSEALQQLLGRIRISPLDEHSEYSALTFPLFIAGCESKDANDRDLVIRSLSKLEANFGIGNVRRAKDMLHILWQGGDMHWLDMLEQLQWDLILA